MKKISLKGLNEVLSEKELKNVLGGSGGACSSGIYCTVAWIDGSTDNYCCPYSNLGTCLDEVSSIAQSEYICGTSCGNC